jgi:hypothetical protein
MKVEEEFGIQEHYLIAILDSLTLLPVLVAGHDLKIDSIRGSVDKCDLITCPFKVSRGLLRAYVRLRVHMIQLYL